MFGFKLCMSATAEMDAPLCRVCSRTDALNSRLYSRRLGRLSINNRSIVSTISFVGTILDYALRFKMGSPDGYGQHHKGTRAPPLA